MEGKSPKVKIIEVSKIEISIGTRKIDLTPEEARKLFTELGKLFILEKRDSVDEMRELIEKVTWPNRIPQYVPIYIESPLPRPEWQFPQITCETNAPIGICKSTLSISC